jgi:hypothetical protein
MKDVKPKQITCVESGLLFNGNNTTFRKCGVLGGIESALLPAFSGSARNQLS